MKKNQLIKCHCDHFEALRLHFDEFRAETEGYFADIKQGSDRVDQRLDNIEKVVVKMDKKFDLVLEIAGRHGSSISYHGATLDRHEARINKLESRLS